MGLRRSQYAREWIADVQVQKVQYMHWYLVLLENRSQWSDAAWEEDSHKYKYGRPRQALGVFLMYSQTERLSSLRVRIDLSYS